MRITKNFTYANKHHRVTFRLTMNGITIELDGIHCNNIVDFTRSGLLHFESYVVIDGDELQVCVYKKQIYIFKDDIDIETGMHKNEKNHLNRFWIVLSWLCYTPLCILFYLVYSDSKFNINIISESNRETIILVAVLLALVVICVTGKNRCNYFLWQPIDLKPRKIIGIVLSVFLSVTISSLIIVIVNFCILG